MSDDNGTTTEGTGTENGDQGTEDRSTWTVDQWKEEAEKWKGLSRKNETQARKNAAAQEKLDKLEADKLSEIEKANKRAQEAEERAKRLELNQLRADVAKAKELPAYLASRLQGSTKEELEEDADSLAKELKLGKPTPDLKQGNKGAAPKDDSGKSVMNSFIKGGRR